jgi:DNA-binding NtrC family response regulator
VKRLLIVDDERHAREGLAQALRGKYAIDLAAGGTEAIALLREKHPPHDLVLTDLRMPGKSGLDVVAFCQHLPRPPRCILMTAYGDIATAVHAMKAGAADFLPKPLDLTAVEAALRRAAEECENGGGGAESIVLGRSPAMGRVWELVRRAAPSEATILLTGETGTGKELVAREIHRLSRRSAGPFLAVNGAALPKEMVESALFGHERGAFTDAHRRHSGYFERAGGGTLLLDEVAELPVETQVKLLRVLETRRFERLGGTETLVADVRLVAASNVNLADAVRRAAFREDLFYRLNVVAIPLPPLRARREDIPLLLEHFWQMQNHPPLLPPETLEILLAYDWPGNVRELRNFCEAMAILHGGESIPPDRLDGRFFAAAPDRPEPAGSAIARALREAGGNRTRAAALLGMGRSTFYRHLREEEKKSCLLPSDP